ncbi:hypothetical protein N0V91_009448 [Didymella pomorum]|uniref:Major facilitator superfamily (MFS) profile domain-containing protein n=1 Tax=Didymella pomorum TaxID=749634 RepID=A0A9W8Z9H3_9PLEO|nr:hypothetical protein N0V91_009448 [Didymella pomorum]
MTAHDAASISKPSAEIVKIENAVPDDESVWIQQYPLLANKSPEELAALNKSVLRKLDWKFLPCITFMLLMNYLDRINVSNARLAGMQEDLHMTDVEWSAGISLFYVGYIISQVPGNVIIAKSSPRVIMPCIMLAWSAVTIAMPACTTPWAFMLCRFLIGLTEGPFLPVIALMTSSWYTKEESPLRMGIWHAGTTISNVISGLLAAGILAHMDDIANLHAWQWFLLIEGMVSILAAGAGFWLLPNFPNNTGTYFFTEEEQQMSQYRVLVSAGGKSEDDEGDMLGGVWMAVKDPYTWFFAGMHFALIIAQSFKDFFPSIMNTLGFGKVETYLVQAPLEHCWHIVGSIAITLIGAVIMISTLNVGARYFSLILLCSGLSWETTVVPRPRTKRAALIAIANCVSSVSHWFSPYFFLRSQEPRYQMGGGIIIAGCGLTIVFCILARWWSIRKNKAIDQEEERTGVVTTWRFAT